MVKGLQLLKGATFEVSADLLPHVIGDSIHQAAAALPLYTAAATAMRSICDINAELNESCKQMARFPILLEYSWRSTWQTQCSGGSGGSGGSSRTEPIFILNDLITFLVMIPCPVLVPSTP